MSGIQTDVSYLQRDTTVKRRSSLRLSDVDVLVCVPAGKSSQWKGTVLDQVPVNPSLYLIKYDGFDCIYGLELYGDERVVGLEVLPDRVGEERFISVSS